MELFKNQKRNMNDGEYVNNQKQSNIILIYNNRKGAILEL